MPLDPAYKAIPIPFYDPKTDKYFEVNMGMDIINWAGDQLLDQTQCVLKATGHVCGFTPWVINHCLTALQEGSRRKIINACDLKAYDPDTVQIRDTELGLLVAPRNSKKISVKWKPEGGEEKTLELTGPLIFTGTGKVTIRQDWQNKEKLIEGTQSNNIEGAGRS